jgi:hypothetical protein
VQFDENYANSNVTINRTDTNAQYFNLTMGENVNFLLVQDHLLYSHTEDGKARTQNIMDGAGFEEFIGHSGTSNIFKTGPMIVYDEIIATAELVADPYKIIEIGKEVT